MFRPGLSSCHFSFVLLEISSPYVFISFLLHNCVIDSILVCLFVAAWLLMWRIGDFFPVWFYFFPATGFYTYYILLHIVSRNYGRISFHCGFVPPKFLVGFFICFHLFSSCIRFPKFENKWFSRINSDIDAPAFLLHCISYIHGKESLIEMIDSTTTHLHFQESLDAKAKSFNVDHGKC